MVLGGIFFILVRKLQKDLINLRPIEIDSTEGSSLEYPKKQVLISPFWIYLLIGAIAGLMFLTRTDGLLWLIIALLVIIVQGYSIRKVKNQGTIFRFLPPILLCLAGFFILCSPWFLRNLSEFGSLFAPGSNRAFWLTVYEDMFAYPASQLTFNRWLNSGLMEILNARGWALGLNMVSMFTVQGGIFLLPLMLGGMWVKRKDWRVSLGILAWIGIFLTMTLVFPFQGARGGFFHAGAALQPLLWALVPAGLVVFIRWGERTRKWNSARALKVFGYSSVGFVIIITFFVTWKRLGLEVLDNPDWGKTERNYQLVEEHMVDLGISPEAIVMVNNPPGYNAMTGRKAIVVPNGDLDTSIQAGKMYDAGFLILDENYPQGLKDLFTNPGDQPGLIYLDNIEQMHIYMFEQ